MSISASMVKELREKTGAGMMDCKKALAETAGDYEQAIDYLRKRGIAKAEKKSGRATKEGAISSYIHGEGRVGVMVEVNCETDFVARTEQFKDLVRNIAMHIAAANPLYVTEDEIPEVVKEKEKEIAIAQLKEQGKPEAMLEKIADGKLKKYFEDVCLLNQSYVKDPDKTIAQYLQEAVGVLGENMTIRRFARFELGEGRDA
jgi:elongation factor Ts